MNKRTDQEALLADVLAEESHEGFGAALLGETLRHARRRRRWRQTCQVGGVLLLLLAGFVVWHDAPRRTQQTERARPQMTTPAFQLIVSQPLDSGQIITTQPLLPNQQIVAAVEVVVVQTRDGEFREVGDDELLTLAAPQIVALVRRGPHAAELVFVPPTGATESQQN